MRSSAMVNCDEEVLMIFFRVKMSFVIIRQMEFVVLVSDDGY